MTQSHAHFSDRTSAPPKRGVFAGAIAAALLALGLSLGSASPALAHDELVDTSFVVNEEDGSLESLVLSFSNTVMDVGTEIVVTGPDGADASGGAPEYSGHDVIQPLAADLQPGTHNVIWRVVSSDGHPIEGALTFDIIEGAGSAPEITEADPSATSDEAQGEAAEEHSHEDEAHDHADETHEHAEDASEEEGPNLWAPILIGVGVVAVVGLTIALTVRRKNALEQSSPEAESIEDAPADDDSTGSGSEDAR
ncbi:MAG: copper resistance CopC family protein [Leucobacter sp.]